MNEHTASTLMTTAFQTLDQDQPAQRAFEILTSADDPAPLVVVDHSQQPLGLITVRDLLRTLLGDQPHDSSQAMAAYGMAIAKSKTCGEILVNVPIFTPGTRLATVLDTMVNAENNNAIVANDGVVKGVLLTTKLFQTVASLSLTHETTGINLDRT